jgi:uncharacterized protein (TIGR02246 family)
MIRTNDQDKEKIREVVATWMRATADGDLTTVLGLIAEDAVFLLPGQAPMRGREAFAAALRSALGRVRIEGKSDIQEIHVVGNYAFCWNQLSLTVTASQGGLAQRRAGPTLSVFRKEPDGRWLLFRDANMLSANPIPDEAPTTIAFFGIAFPMFWRTENTLGVLSDLSLSRL